MWETRLAALASLLVLLLAACAPEAAPAPQMPAPAVAPAPAPAPAAAVPVAPAKPAWEQEWERTLVAAKKESRVIIHTVGGGEVRLAFTKIAKLQGIDAEVISMRTAELLPKVFAERRAGLYLNDIYIGGGQTMLNTAKPAGIMEAIDSALILPDVTDPQLIKKVWYRGELPWCDKDHTVFLLSLQPGLAITINTNLVKPDEVKSWRDVLDPKWKGKFAFNDPSIGGYPQMAVQTMVHLIGEDSVKELVQAKPIIIRDQRQLVEWLAFGKIAIAMPTPVDIVTEFLRAGAPIKPIIPQEGTWLGAGNAGNMILFKNAAHPNASKVFINLITSKEGQDILAPAGGFNSTREDVSTAHLLPGLARTAGGKYFPAYNEENSTVDWPVIGKMIKEVFAPLLTK